MADNIQIDFSDVIRLAADLSDVPDNAGPKIRQAVEVTARNIKDAWRGDVAGSRLAPGGERDISYDIEVSHPSGGSVIEADIGPVLGGAGSLVGFIEYGTPTTGPKGYGAAALESNQADFERGLEIALEQSERQAGL